MNYDVPKDHKQILVIERAQTGFIEVVRKDCAENDYAKKQHEGPDLGGYPFRSVTSTASVGTPTISGTTSYRIEFLPREGPVPVYELQNQAFANKVERIVNPTKAK